MEREMSTVYSGDLGLPSYVDVGVRGEFEGHELPRAVSSARPVIVRAEVIGTTGTHRPIDEPGVFASITAFGTDSSPVIVPVISAYLPRGVESWLHGSYQAWNLTFAHVEDTTVAPASLRPVVSWSDGLSAMDALAVSAQAQREAEIAARFEEEMRNLESEERF